MPDEILQIGASFDVGPVTSGMDQAASSVQAGAARMAESFQKSGMSAREAASALKNLGFSVSEVASAMGAAAPAIDQVSAAADRSTRSFANARIAGQGFLQEVGIRGPRVLTAFLAQSQTIGPILRGAFAGVAVIGLLEVLGQVPDAIDKIVGKLTGWDAAARKTYDDMVRGNIEIMKSNIELADRLDTLKTSGATGFEKIRMEIDNLANSTARWAALSVTAHRSLVDLGAESEKLNKTSTSWIDALKDPFKFPAALRAELEGTHTKIEENEKATKMWTEQTEELAKKLRSQPVEQKAVINTEQIELAKRDLEEWARMQDKLGKEQEEAAVRRGNAQREAAEQAERFDEEQDKRDMAMAQTDLAEFEKTLQRKQRLSEEYAIHDAGDIGAAAEQKEKGLATTSRFGAVDPAIIQAATAAYNQQVAVLDQVIQKEHEIQAASAESGDTADREAYLASLQREQTLLAQMDNAYKKLQSTIQSVADKQYQVMAKSFEHITGSLNSNLISWMNGSETFGRAMEKVWTSIADTAIESVLTMSEKWVEGIAIQKAQALISKMTNASVAAGGAYASQAAIPVVGPALGLGAATEAFATVMAFEHGGIVPETSMAMLHKSEMVLPANISQTVQNIAESGGGAGAGHTFNYSPTLNGSGDASTKDMLARHGKQFVNYAVREMRRRHM